MISPNVNLDGEEGAWFAGPRRWEEATVGGGIVAKGVIGGTLSTTRTWGGEIDRSLGKISECTVNPSVTVALLWMIGEISRQGLIAADLEKNGFFLFWNLG